MAAKGRVGPALASPSKEVGGEALAEGRWTEATGALEKLTLTLRQENQAPAASQCRHF